MLVAHESSGHPARPYGLVKVLHDEDGPALVTAGYKLLYFTGVLVADFWVHNAEER